MVSVDPEISHLQFIIEAMPDGILVIDENEKIVAYNRKYREIWKVPDEVLETRDNRQFMRFAENLIKDPERFVSVTKQFHAAPVKDYSDVLELNDGRFIERHSTPRHPGGGIFSRMLTFRDITDRTRAEHLLRESESRFRNIFSSDMIGIVYAKNFERILAANDYFLNLVGYTRDELEAGEITWRKITPPEYFEVTQLNIDEANTGKAKTFEKEYVRKNGERISVLIGLSNPADSRESVAFILDITERKRAEEALRTSEERFRTIFEGGAFGVTLFDLKGEFMACNPAICEMLGYSEEELKRIGIRGVSHPDDFDGRNRKLLEDLVAGKIDKFELDKRYIRKDGREIWAYLISSLVRNHAGKPVYGIGVLVDRTRQRHFEEQLRLSESRFRAIFTAAPTGVLLGDLAGHFTACNPAICEMLGYTEVELLRAGPKGIALAEDHAWVDSLVSVLASGEQDRVEGERRVVRKDGSVCWVSLAASLVRDPSGKPLFSVSVLADITVRKTAEEAMLNAVRLRDEFIAIASHELRTPITPLRLQNHLLKRHLTTGQFATYPQAQSVLRMVDASEHQLDHLVRLIEDMLNASRISSGRLPLEIEDFDLSALIEESVARHRDEFAKAGCTVKLDLQPGVTGSWDRMRVEQALTNLLLNAAKYGRGKPIEIGTASVGSEARIFVRDHGIGIAKEDQSKIFEQFERVAPVNAYGGFGLGLYITRQIVAAHGGTIAVESELSLGATFTICLPR